MTLGKSCAEEGMVVFYHLENGAMNDCVSMKCVKFEPDEEDSDRKVDGFVEWDLFLGVE